MLISEKYIINIARDIDPPRKKMWFQRLSEGISSAASEPAPNPIYGDWENAILNYNKKLINNKK